MKKVTAVFDIGKTNKKFFLFDSDFKEVHKEYTSFDEIEDEDGHPTENLPELQKWLKTVFNRILKAKEFDVKAINFSTYGASLVHIDEDGNPLTPLYNYTKPLPENIVTTFFEEHGPREEFLKNTGCADLSMLNSGLQLYWLKKSKPEIYSKIKYSLHLPQYLSYIFTGIPLSEYTSIGCHTALWDYGKKDYHSWVYNESIKDAINYMRINGKPVKASRLFLGNEYKLQVAKLDKRFGVNDDYHRSVKFDYDTYFEIIQDFKHCYKWESIVDEDMPEQTQMSYHKYEHAYHQLMTELVLLQIKCIKKAIGDDTILRLYVDGGFSDNDVYIKLLSHYFRDKKLRTTNASLGSALGAAISISDAKLNSKFLKKNYALKKHVPFIIS